MTTKDKELTLTGKYLLKLIDAGDFEAFHKEALELVKKSDDIFIKEKNYSHKEKLVLNDAYQAVADAFEQSTISRKLLSFGKHEAIQLVTKLPFIWSDTLFIRLEKSEGNNALYAALIADEMAQKPEHYQRAFWKALFSQFVSFHYFMSNDGEKFTNEFSTTYESRIAKEFRKDSRSLIAQYKCFMDSFADAALKWSDRNEDLESFLKVITNATCRNPYMVKQVAYPNVKLFTPTLVQSLLDSLKIRLLHMEHITTWGMIIMECDCLAYLSFRSNAPTDIPGIAKLVHEMKGLYSVQLEDSKLAKKPEERRSQTHCHFSEKNFFEPCSEKEFLELIFNHSYMNGMLDVIVWSSENVSLLVNLQSMFYFKDCDKLLAPKQDFQFDTAMNYAFKMDRTVPDWNREGFFKLVAASDPWKNLSTNEAEKWYQKAKSESLFWQLFRRPRHELSLKMQEYAWLHKDQLQKRLV